MEAREIFAVVGGVLLAASGDVSAAVKPNHDGAFTVVVDARRPHIEVEAVFVLDAVGPVEHPGVLVFGPTGACGLGRDVAVLHGAAQAGPWLGLGGGHETRGAFGAGAEGDAFEGVDAVAGVAADFSGGGFDDVGFAGGGDGGAGGGAGVGRGRRLRSCFRVQVGDEVCGGGAGEDGCGLDQGTASELGHVIVPYFVVKTFSRLRVGTVARRRRECITSTDVGARLVSSATRRQVRRGPGRGGGVRGRGWRGGRWRA